MSNLETVQAIYSAFGRGDIPTILEQLDENIQWEEHNLDHGIPWIFPGQGIETVQRFFGVVGEQLEFQRFEVSEICAGQQVVTALIHVKIHVRATGRVIEDQEAHVWRFNSVGKVVGFRHIVDTIQHQQAAKA